MKEVIYYISSSVVTGIFPIAFIFIVVSFSMKMQKKFFKDLFNKFESQEKAPVESTRTMRFQYGENVRMQNAVRVGERQDALFIKLPMVKALKIPFGQISSITTKKSVFKSTVITVNFTDENLNPLHITIKTSQINKFPQLLGKAKEVEGISEVDKFGEAAYEAANQFFKKDGDLDIAKVKQTLISKNPQLAAKVQGKAKEAVANFIRGAAVIMLIIIGLVFLLRYYG